MHKVLITHQLPGDKIHELSSSSEVTVWMGPGLLGAEALREELKDCVGVVCMLTDRIDEKLLDACPQLKFISSMSVGVDHIDVAAASERSIAVGNTPGVLVETTADATFALLLAASRRIAEADLYVRGGHWSDENAWSPDFFVGKDVAGATLGIIGLGEVGKAVSRRAKGFGMRVLGWNHREKSVAGIESVSLEQLLNDSDFVCITIALAKETRHLIDADKLALMKHDAVLINTSRGGIVDEEALVDALVNGRLGSAALDVFAREPLAADHPLVRLPNVVLTPHIGSATHDTRCKMADMAAANALAALSEQPMPSCVNPEVYER
ncbi:MAG: D-glycerate dehydrogenase [Pseudomonadota bacterium]